MKRVRKRPASVGAAEEEAATAMGTLRVLLWRPGQLQTLEEIVQSHGRRVVCFSLLLVGRCH
ncbi:hypothetical protein E2562_025695 [Oryza meyeriana var. granulata]|uniref:Uncharacterized protein n=1 Tax=Oryza meyeriana var. granulata TaxID=110450 RepID=A0A6G1FCR4_9ORYZ|nr:hypothetical protein E2562_025695 [Oryza meyeriana var. granulata]